MNNSYPPPLCFCKNDNFKKHELYLQDHLLTFILSGSVQVIQGEKTYSFNAGETVLLKRNQNVQLVFNPSNNGNPFRSISLSLRKLDIQQYKDANPLIHIENYSRQE